MLNTNKIEKQRETSRLINEKLSEISVLTNDYNHKKPKQKKKDLFLAYLKRIERLVLSGGGAKGVIYPGGYRALQDTGVLKGIKEISGTSVGAIMAALIAVGMPTGKFREKLLHTNFKDLLGATIGSLTKTLSPGTHNEAGVTFFTKDGAGILELVRDNIEETLREFLVQNAEEVNSLQEEDEDLFNLVNKISSEYPKITFSDLALLNKHWPNTFMQLTIPALRHPDGKLQIFNADKTPNVEIALACRASASIPVILEPVEIDLDDGRGPQKFVDAGLFDNLPTDYFDTNQDGDFEPNKKPEQTLIFAFGEGLDNQKNQVYQALYGNRWDEVLSERFIMSIFESAAILMANKLGTDGLLTYSTLSEFLKPAMNQVLDNFITTAETSEETSLYERVAELIKKTSEKTLKKMDNNPEKYPNLFDKLNDGAAILKIDALAVYIKEAIRPVLYEVGLIDNLRRNKLASLLGDFNPPYKSTEQKEAGYQKLRSEYPLRTVELRIGNIKTTDFKAATKHARVMDTLGYLDTINHLTNHELHDPKVFDADQFYVDLVKNFEKIYKALLTSTNKKISKNSLLNEISTLRHTLATKDEVIVSRQIYQAIKDKVETDLESCAAFALSRAVEFRSRILTAENLFKETYKESLNRSSTFSHGNFSSVSFFTCDTPQNSLKNKDMVNLFEENEQHREDSLSEKILAALNELDNFSSAYRQEQELEQDLIQEIIGY